MEYINLGLPSGTLWVDTDEKGYYKFGEAVCKYGNNLPTREQWKELKDNYYWKWIGNGYRVTGQNGNSIVLTGKFERCCDGSFFFMDFFKQYWSSTPERPNAAWMLYFYSTGVYMGIFKHYSDKSVRLVKK